MKITPYREGSFPSHSGKSNPWFDPETGLLRASESRIAHEYSVDLEAQGYSPEEAEALSDPYKPVHSPESLDRSINQLYEGLANPSSLIDSFLRGY